MKKLYDVLFVVVLVAVVITAVVFALCHEHKEIQKKERTDAAYNLLDTKGGIARFPELAVIDLDTSGGSYSDQDLVSSYRTEKHILKDPVTGDLFVGLRIYIGGIGIFKVDEEGKILQEYSREEFYKLGVVDRLVK